ncbi:MAG: helix-turn-helix transcriptional regulator [Candidatus Paceibacterota bacterium]
MNNIKHLREIKGITQVELARRVGVDRSHMNRVENNKIKPGISLSLRISKALECSLDDIFLG